MEKSLYIHIPFCAKKCMYCDFPSFCGKETLMLDYAEALSLEIEKTTREHIFNTVFIGGGTPTYLSLEAWKILSRCIGGLKKGNNFEFTVECNPGTADSDKLKFLKELGVNRLSIGLQAWQNSILEALGRVHRVEEFLHKKTLYQ